MMIIIIIIIRPDSSIQMTRFLSTNDQIPHYVSLLFVMFFWIFTNPLTWLVTGFSFLLNKNEWNSPNINKTNQSFRQNKEKNPEQCVKLMGKTRWMSIHSVTWADDCVQKEDIDTYSWILVSISAYWVLILVAGCWLLVTGCWLLFFGCSLLITGYWSLCNWLLDTGYWILVTGDWWLVITTY